MARIGKGVYLNELKKPEYIPKDFTGRPMKGSIFVTPDGFNTDEHLGYWLDLGLAFNLLAKASKPKTIAKN